MTMLGPCRQPLKIPLYYQKSLPSGRGGRQGLNQNWSNCATRCRTEHSPSGRDESRAAGVTRGMPTPIGLLRASNWVSRRIWCCSEAPERPDVYAETGVLINQIVHWAKLSAEPR